MTTPSIMDWLPVVRGQDVEEQIWCPCYLLCAIGKGTTMLCQKPEDLLPLSHLIFFNRNQHIHARFRTNNGPDCLELIVLESGCEDGENLDDSPCVCQWKVPLFWPRGLRWLCRGRRLCGSNGGEGFCKRWGMARGRACAGTWMPPGTGVIYLDNREVGI